MQSTYRRAGTGGLGVYKGGQFIPRATWEGEKTKAAAGLTPLLIDFGIELEFLRGVYEQQAIIETVPDALSALSRAGVKPVSEKAIEFRLKRSIRNTYLSAFTLGKRAAGNLLSITPGDASLLEGLRRDEYGYLRKFLGDMRARTGTLPYTERMAWYAAAARELYWYGFLFGDLSPGRMVEWTLGPTEHCSSCRSMVGVWKAVELAAHVQKTGFLPQSGRLECRGYKCQCGLKGVSG